MHKMDLKACGWKVCGGAFFQIVGAFICQAVAIVLALGQPIVLEPNAPTFEVVSVKPNGTNSIAVNTPLGQGCHNSPGRLTCNLTLSGMLERAFSVSSWQVLAPDWTKSEIYLLSAAMPVETDRKLIRPMIRTMLFERFGLKVHREQKETSVYALVVGRRGSKLSEVADPGGSEYHAGRGEFSATAISMETFAGNLTSPAGRPVIDQTGLKGFYKLELQWTPEYEEPSGSGRKEVGILHILEEKLGLKLEPRKVPFDRIVVDHVNRVPTEN